MQATRNLAAYGPPPEQRFAQLPEDAQPVADYRSALWGASSFLARWRIDEASPVHDFVVRFIADIYWLRPEKVVSDLRKLRGIS